MAGRQLENFKVIALFQVRQWESTTCLWRWKYQNPPGDELQTPGTQSVACLMTPDARADKRRSRSYLGAIEGDFSLHITHAN